MRPCSRIYYSNVSNVLVAGCRCDG